MSKRFYIDMIRFLYYNVLQKGAIFMTISIRLDDNDSKLIKAYAELNGMTVSEAIRKAMLERIEDEFDLKAYEEALAEYQNDPVTYSLEEMEREINEIHG